MHKAGTGRRTKLTEETKERLFSALKRGAHLEAACQAAGVDYGTVSEWIRRGEGRDRRSQTTQHAAFAEEIKKAIADAEISLLSKVRIAAEGDWRAASWILERRHPDRWAASQKVRILAEQQVEAELNLVFEAIANDAKLTKEAKERVFEIIANLQAQALAGEMN